LTNQKQELPVAAMCVYGSGQNEQFYGGPPIDASYQDLIHLAKRFQRRRIFETDQSEKSNCLCQPCLLTDQDKMSKLYREPSIDAN
jgi:hypothetical protein